MARAEVQETDGRAFDRLGDQAGGPKNRAPAPGPDADPDPDWQRAVDAIITAGRRLDRAGWVPATAGNLSCRLACGRIAITRSGGHKGFLGPDGVIEVDLDSRPARAGDRPSAETGLHCQIYALVPGSRAVLHGHSVAATALSLALPRGESLVFEGFELVKAFDPAASHLDRRRLLVVDNDQDIPRLCRTLAPLLGDLELPAYLIRGHGAYVWGRSMDEALHRLEALEFLLSCLLERRRFAS